MHAEDSWVDVGRGLTDVNRLVGTGTLVFVGKVAEGSRRGRVTVGWAARSREVGS